jgi:GT2 family glycosyltransferase
MEDITKYKVAVLVLCTNEKHFMDDCMSSLVVQTHKNTTIYLLDNNSSDGSVEYVKEKFPQVKILQFESNLGYAKANNNGLKEAFDIDHVDFSLVLNSDVKCSPNMIGEMLKTYESKRKENIKVGLIQPVVLLFDEPEKLNTAGNAIHYLGFGYCKDYKKKYEPFNTDKEIIFASGAAMLVSREYYDDIGLINEDFFIYYEDQNYSWRGLLKGYKHFVCSRAELLHKYRFKSYPFKMYHSEKNRVMILLENYRWKTLFLLSPALTLNGILLITHSIFNGWFKSKMKAMFYIVSHFRYIMSIRKQIQKDRSVSDKELIKKFESRIDFEATDNKITKNIVSPLYSLYYKLIIKII